MGNVDSCETCGGRTGQPLSSIIAAEWRLCVCVGRPTLSSLKPPAQTWPLYEFGTKDYVTFFFEGKDSDLEAECSDTLVDTGPTSA